MFIITVTVTRAGVTIALNITVSYSKKRKEIYKIQKRDQERLRFLLTENNKKSFTTIFIEKY